MTESDWDFFHISRIEKELFSKITIFREIKLGKWVNPEEVTTDQDLGSKISQNKSL